MIGARHEKNLLVEQQKQAYYFSIEFLPGKLLKSNLLNLGLLDTAEESSSKSYPFH